MHDMDTLPFVTPVYKRDLVMENYFIGYLKHPYISFYTGAAARAAARSACGRRRSAAIAIGPAPLGTSSRRCVTSSRRSRR